MCIVVSSDCPLTNITRAQLAGIYEGSITDWADLGWAAGGTIQPRARIVGSGTRASLLDLLKSYGLDEAEELVTCGADGDPSRLDGNPDMVLAIANDPESNAIGYVGVGFLGTNSSIKALDLEGTAPTVDTSLRRPTPAGAICICTPLIPTPPPTPWLMNSSAFIMSDAGQKHLRGRGLPVLPALMGPQRRPQGQHRRCSLLGNKWGADRRCRLVPRGYQL